MQIEEETQHHIEEGAPLRDEIGLESHNLQQEIPEMGEADSLQTGYPGLGLSDVGGGIIEGEDLAVGMTVRSHIGCSYLA